MVKSLIKELGLFTKKSWPGTNFYGLTTSGYNKRLEEESHSLPSDKSAKQNEQPSSVTNSSYSKQADKLSNDKIYQWVNVLSLGNVSNASLKYNNAPINVGYVSQRLVHCKSGKKVLMTCEVKDSEAGQQYNCSAKVSKLNKDGQEEEFIEQFEHPFISTAVNSFLKNNVKCIGTVTTFWPQRITLQNRFHLVF